MQVRFDHGPDGTEAQFAAPRRMIVADKPSDVIPALVELDKVRAQGHWLAGYATYEAGYALEPKLAGLMPSNRRLPLICFGVYDAPAPAEPLCGKAGLSALQPQWDKDRYTASFGQVKRAIGAGEIYQANLTFPINARTEGAPQALYASLRERQPVDYGTMVEQPDGISILSRSPELFFRTDAGGRIQTRPMKGTMPRDDNPSQDEANRAFLQNDEKNRAENLMIVDLLRNDISRVAEISSVKVPELYKVKSYTTVHQLVSTITAQLKPGAGLADIFAALFPCGSITGAPKIRAMEILAELETGPREMYCGTLGWVAPDGRSEFNVAIRTVLLENGRAILNVGGGVVWDSTAASEYEEALWKARFAKTTHSSFQMELS